MSQMEYDIGFWVSIVGSVLPFALAILAYVAYERLTHWWQRRTHRTEQAEKQPVGARVGNRPPDPHDGAGKAA